MGKARRSDTKHSAGNRPRSSLRKILHPTDFSYDSDVAFAHALKIALGCQASLDILHVEPAGREASMKAFPAVRETLIRWGFLGEDAVAADVARLGIRIRKLAANDNDPAHGISEFLRRHPRDLMVISTHRRKGIRRWMNREIATRVARESRTATLFVPRGTTGFVDVDDGAVSLQNILLPVVAVPSPRPAIGCMTEIARALDAGDAIVSMLHSLADQSDIGRLQLPTDGDLKWQWTVAADQVIPGILTAAEDQEADLIAMTTLGHDEIADSVLGSTTERVLQNAPCPVLAVHGVAPAKIRIPHLAEFARQLEQMLRGRSKLVEGA